ncbi:MAG: hypothetical protein AAB362_00870 [Patescibacteria group bacterium]
MNGGDFIRIYDGALACADCSKCPVIDILLETNEFVIHDPSAPERGAFKMGAGEFEALKHWFKTHI